MEPRQQRGTVEVIEVQMAAAGREMSSMSAASADPVMVSPSQDAAQGRRDRLGHAQEAEIVGMDAVHGVLVIAAEQRGARPLSKTRPMPS